MGRTHLPPSGNIGSPARAQPGCGTARDPAAAAIEGAGPGPASIQPPCPPPTWGGEGGGRLRSAAGVISRWRPPKPPDAAGPARAGPSASGATSTAPDERGGVESPPQSPPPRRSASEWLPPLAFLPPRHTTPTTAGWTRWASSQGTPHRQRHSGLDGPGPRDWSPQQVVDAWTAAHAADLVYDSMDGLAAAWHASMASLTAMPWPCHVLVEDF